MTDELQPGRELDARIALDVMGWKAPRIGIENRPPFPVAQFDYFNPPPEVEAWRSDYHWQDPGGGCWDAPPRFSTKVEDAWLVVEKLGLGIIKVDYGWMAFLDDGHGYVSKLVIDVSLDASATADTAPHAICLAALKVAALPAAAPPRAA